MPAINARPNLFELFGLDNFHDLKLTVGDDFYLIEVPYESETAHVIQAAFDWHQR